MSGVLGGLVNRLRGLACPAGQPWTGNTPESDHGHTDCWIIHLAAHQLEQARTIIADMLDPDDCQHDHHGYCQAHGWLTSGKCPHARARRFLEETE